MTKSLSNRLYLKQRLYSFKFSDDRLDQFNKIVDDLGIVDAKLDEEDKAIAKLNALPKSFEHLRDPLLYGWEKAITIVEVQTVLKSKDQQKTETAAPETPPDVLNIKLQARGQE